MHLEDFRQWWKKHQEKTIAEYLEFLRFPTVGTQRQHHADMWACANWLSRQLGDIGLSSTIWEFPDGQPSVFAEKIVDSHYPTLLFYQHYDIQPPEPMNLWKTPPFEPTIKDGVVFARGAQDNKGQCHYVITALKAFLELVRELKFNLKIIIDGEEESGSPSLHHHAQKYKEQLSADYLLIVDMGIESFARPALTVGCRGIVTMEVECRVSDTDMHSGSHGGIAANPILLLSKALGAMYDGEGHIVIPRFYEDVMPVAVEEQEKFDLTFDRLQYQKDFGVRSFVRSDDSNPKEAQMFSPTLEINGISGGYTEEGFKTVLPAAARSKISCRLVPGQDPHRVYRCVTEFLRSQIPPAVEMHFWEHGHGEAYRASVDNEWTRIVVQAYQKALDMPIHLHTSGGSIPIVGLLAEISGAECVFPGTGLDSDNIHAPNEHFSLMQYEKGFDIIVSILLTLGESI